MVSWAIREFRRLFGFGEVCGRGGIFVDAWGSIARWRVNVKHGVVALRVGNGGRGDCGHCGCRGRWLG